MRSIASRIFDCLIPDSNDPRALETWRVSVGIILMLLIVSVTAGTWLAASEHGFATKSQFNALYDRIQASDERMIRTELRKLRREQCLAIVKNDTSEMRWTRRFIEEMRMEYWNVTSRSWEKPPCEEIIPGGTNG